MDALAASNAYESIVHALQNATSAAAMAKRNAEEAFAVVDPNSEGSLATMANASAIKSEELNRRVDSALESLGVREQSERLEKTLDEIEASMKEAQRKLGTIKDVQQLLEDHHDRINTVYTAVDEAHSSLGDIEEGVTEFNDAVTELKLRTDAVQQFTSASIQVNMDTVINLSYCI
jgi:chromosome segregation ATPase